MAFQRRRRFARGRALKGEMNTNEQQYAEHLQRLKDGGTVLDYQFEKITFKLAPRTTLTIDFIVVRSDLTLEFHEVKGGKKTGKYHVEEDAWLKLKMAAAQFPWLRILVVWHHKDYGWKTVEVGDHGENTLDTEE